MGIFVVCLGVEAKLLPYPLNTFRTILLSDSSALECDSTITHVLNVLLEV